MAGEGLSQITKVFSLRDTVSKSLAIGQMAAGPLKPEKLAEGSSLRLTLAIGRCLLYDYQAPFESHLWRDR